MSNRSRMFGFSDKENYVIDGKVVSFKYESYSDIPFWDTNWDMGFCKIGHNYSKFSLFELLLPSWVEGKSRESIALGRLYFSPECSEEEAIFAKNLFLVIVQRLPTMMKGEFKFKVHKCAFSSENFNEEFNKVLGGFFQPPTFSDSDSVDLLPDPSMLASPNYLEFQEQVGEFYLNSMSELLCKSL